jgi:hypothetical protein
MTTDPTRFYIDFADGRCRLSHGRTFEEACEDALEAANNTNTPCKVLDSTYTCLAEVKYLTAGKRYQLTMKKGTS